MSSRPGIMSSRPGIMSSRPGIMSSRPGTSSRPDIKREGLVIAAARHS